MNTSPTDADGFQRDVGAIWIRQQFLLGVGIYGIACGSGTFVSRLNFAEKMVRRYSIQ